ncbi:uncharacterized protein LOC127878142 isoform X1 [Dreissena polymorpha]|uniref:Uncharacterized protein n=1 Tax=Dreissena polymorpha TaxID=45954 RepID=A0A9D4K2Y1_DREPO|nr:uncharacterized protein LOC127878142 isoform X1 [Dreissena polymorpha]KAH3830958.1 hypothetical protein DPMN_104215 [Dreissena polymorpha]
MGNGSIGRHGNQNRSQEEEGVAKWSSFKFTERLHAITNGAELATYLEELTRFTSDLQAEIESRTVDNKRMKEENTRLTSQLEQVIAERDRLNSYILKLKEEITSFKIK